MSGEPIPDERLRLIPHAERTAEEEAEWRRLQAEPMPRDDADDQDVRTHPDLAWDFRVPRVASINASGHKYGLVYPGIGWAL